MASKVYQQIKADEAKAAELKAAIARGASESQLDQIIERYAPPQKPKPEGIAL
jgi:hypothetical protein